MRAGAVPQRDDPEHEAKRMSAEDLLTRDQAKALARLSPDDPELMPELAAQRYAGVGAFVERTADLDPEQRNTAVKRAVESATTAGKSAGQVFTAGYLEANAQAFAVATSKG